MPTKDTELTTAHAPTTATPHAQAHMGGALPLPHWGVIRAQGADAAKFLHGQLTQDFALLGQAEARLAAFCSPKGRMLASFIGFKLSADEVLLACHRDLLPATLKRLSMFVMRAKCTLSDASDQFSLHGLAGPSADALAHATGLADTTWAKVPLNTGAGAGSESGAGTHAHAGALVRLPPATHSATHPIINPAGGSDHPSTFHGAEDSPHTTRLLACLPVGTPLAQAWPVGLNAAATHPLPDLASSAWDWLEVGSGVALVTQAVSEAFVPQMLNYESVGGVNFKKGCYPGQEVVARSQFRGTLKRRAYRVSSPQPLVVGQDVFHSSDAEQACGTVVATAQHGGQVQALVSMTTAATGGGSLTAGGPSGPTLGLMTLPYPLLADI